MKETVIMPNTEKDGDEIEQAREVLELFEKLTAEQQEMVLREMDRMIIEGTGYQVIPR